MQIGQKTIRAKPSAFGQNIRNSTILLTVLDRLQVLTQKLTRIWFGDSALEIVQQRHIEGLTSPLFFERVGYTSYLRKGGRQ